MATSRVVVLPEFLIGLFKQTHNNDYASCALVCKLWSDLVLDCAWRKISDDSMLRKLFQLLAPLCLDERERRFYFSRPIRPADWDIFKKYYHRIRAINCQFHGIHSSVFAAVVSTCPYPGPLLPNLCELISDSSFDVINLFASNRGLSSSSFSNLKITAYHLFNCTGGKELKLIVRHIPLWMPNIQSLTFESSTEDELTKEMTEIIPKLRFLNTLHIQMAYLTPKVTEALARLPCLRLLSGDGSYDDLEYVFSDKLQPESFPVLEELSLFMDMDRAAVCFSLSFAPTCLKNLSIGACYAVPATSFASIIHWAACQTPLLESLSICVDPEDPMGPYEAVEDILPLSLSVMRPLYTCAHLSSLAISYTIPISMEEFELIALVTALPTLRRLDLGQFQTIPPTDTDNSNSTSSPSQPGISSSFLPILAPLCASLEFLCLYISFNNLSNPESLSVVTTRFMSLRTFDVWQSPCKDSSPVVAALFMSRLLPSFCELTYRKTRRSAWKDVVSALQVVRMARSDGAEECGSTLAC